MATLHDLPQFLRDMIASPPRSGGGFHDWLYKIARQLHAHRTEQEIFALLKALSEDCGRDVPDREIAGAVRDSMATAWRPGQPTTGTAPRAESKWPDVDYDFIKEEVIRPRFNVLRLREASPVPIGGLTTQHVLPLMFPGNPLITVGDSEERFRTDYLANHIADAQERSFIVPSGCTACEGLTKDGKKVSQHCLSIVGPRQYLVLETDFKPDNGAGELLAYAKAEHGLYPLDVAACVLEYLSQFLPALALVVHSGGKSLHGFFNVADMSTPGEPDGTAGLYDFMQSAVIVGADRAGWVRSQFARMPGGTRRNKDGSIKGEQRILFFNPKHSLSHAHPQR